MTARRAHMSARNSNGGKAPRPITSRPPIEEEEELYQQQRPTGLYNLSEKHLARITAAVQDALDNPLVMPIMLWWWAEDGPEYMAFHPLALKPAVAFLVRLERLFHAPENEHASIFAPSSYLDEHRQLMWAAQEYQSTGSQQLFAAVFGVPTLGSFVSRFCFDELSHRLYFQQCSC